MKFYSTIDYRFCQKHALSLAEAHLFEWIYSLPSWADKVTVSGKDYYFASRNKAIQELPIITDKPDTMYRYYKSLVDKGLIIVKKIDGKDYIMLTDSAKDWGRLKGGKSENSEKNPTELGNISEINSEKNPTNNITIKNNKTKDNDSPSGDYSKVMEVYFDFFKNKTGQNPTISGRDGAALKLLINRLKKSGIENVSGHLRDVFDQWPKLSKFLQSQITISQIDHFYNNIIAELRSGSQQVSKLDNIILANQKAHEQVTNKATSND